MSRQDRIVVDPANLAVEFVLEWSAERWSRGQVEQDDPSLAAEDPRAALHRACDLMKGELSYPAPMSCG